MALCEPSAYQLDNRALVAHDKVRYAYTIDDIRHDFRSSIADAVLTCDVRRASGLKRGDIVKLVDHHVAPDGTEGYSIEVFNARGRILLPSPPYPCASLEPLREDEIALRLCSL